MMRLRLISMSLAVAICAAVFGGAVFSKFSAFTDMFDESEAVKVEVEEKEKPPPPPPPPPPDRLPPPPPPEQRVPPPSFEAPPTDYQGPTAAETRPAEPQELTGVTWLAEPDGRDYERFFPPRALEQGRSGTVTLDCIVSADGRINCSVVSESPSGMGFGAASLRAAREFRVAPQTAAGQPTSGGRVRKTIRWNAG